MPPLVLWQFCVKYSLAPLWLQVPLLLPPETHVPLLLLQLFPASQ
jgi:hypothetical protein